MGKIWGNLGGGLFYLPGKHGKFRRGFQGKFRSNFRGTFGNFVSNFATFFGNFVHQKGGANKEPEAFLWICASLFAFVNIPFYYTNFSGHEVSTAIPSPEHLKKVYAWSGRCLVGPSLNNMS